MKLISLADRNE